MLLCGLEIKNFRSLASLTFVFKSNINVIIGKNNAGKSNLLNAIRKFFKENPTINENDYFNEIYEHPISIFFHIKFESDNEIIGFYSNEPKLVAILNSSIIRNELHNLKDTLIKKLNEEVNSNVIDDIVLK